MMRNGAEIEVLQALLGDFVVVFAVLTQLGDVWFYFTVLGTWYWFGTRMPLLGPGLDRHRGARAIALAIGAMALVVGLKGLFALERPPGADAPVAVEAVPQFLRGLYVEAATATGYDFPSGHALGTTAVWGGVAWLYRGGNRRRRLAVAAAIVLVASVSRVALGVHYGVSVLGGVVVGAVYLLVALRAGATTTRLFGLAAVLAAGAVVTTSADAKAVAILGFAVGGLATWLAVGERIPRQPASTRRGALTALVGLMATGPLFGASVVLSLSAVVVVAAAVAIAGVLTVPLVVERVGEKTASVGIPG